jgi:AraC family transcriptional regulator
MSVAMSDAQGAASAFFRYDAEILAETRGDWNGFGVVSSRRRVTGRREFDLYLRQHLVSATFDGGIRYVEGCLDDGRTRRFVVRPGQVCFLPANRRFQGHTEGVGTHRNIMVFFDPAMVGRASGGDVDSARLDLDLSVDVTSPAILQSMAALAHEVEQPGPMGRVYAESLALVILTEVIRRHGAVADNARWASSQAALRCRRVMDYVEAHLGEDLSLLRLAAEASLSPVHFAREFKRLFGLSPHQYVLRRRVERAAGLLDAGAPSISEVAFAVGFSSQSHLTAAFRGLYGTTPAAFRARRQAGW